MRLTGIRLPLLAAVACASVGLSLSATDRSYGQAVYVYPTSTTISLSTPYLLPTAYVVPSSYAFPSYIESSYTADPAVSLLPTGYIETTYRRGLFGRRWIVERPVVASYATSYLPTTYVPTTYVSAYVPTTYVSPTYYPTSYRVRRYRPTTYAYSPTTYYPTVYETAYASSADICCGDEIVVEPPARSAQTGSVASTAPNGGSKEVESRSLEDPTIPSYVDPPLPDERTKARSTVRSDDTNRTGAGSAASPPIPPPADEEDAVSKAATKGAAGGAATQKNAPAQKSSGAATPKTKAAAPTAPSGEIDPNDLRPASGGEESFRRESMKAIYPRVRAADRRNILFGSVETDDGRPRGEVPVIVINRNNSAIRHTGLSNAFGGFAIKVPDGQWRVRVTMPSGSAQTVRDITVTDGKVVDNYEAREVHNLIISY